MKVLICVALLVAVTLAEKCPVTIDLQAKQDAINRLLKSVNKPFNPKVSVPPMPDDVSNIKLGVLPKREVFSIFDERTWPEGIEVVKRLLTPKTFDEFIKQAEILYPRINEDLFFYCLSVAIVHRLDTQGLKVPRIQDVYPDKFFEHQLLVKIKDEIMTGHKNPELNDTHDFHNHYDLYRRIDYFTEDFGMNAHHYHWHVVHPMFKPDVLPGGDKKRSGELFYWMHRQMVARFDSELMSNNIPRIRSFENWNEPIPIGYAPHLTIHRTGYKYGFRPDNMVLRNLPELTKYEMKQWETRILRSIHKSKINQPLGNSIGLNDTDTLAHLIMSSTDSANRQYYGNLHSYAHVIAARITDPRNKFREDGGVMSDAAVSARDPIFYQWHKYVDSIFQAYQKTLKPYRSSELEWTDVTVNEVYIDATKEHPRNEIRTFWGMNDFRLTKGFDYTIDSEAVIHLRHLDHEPFTYVFDVNNNRNKEREAVFRVYMVPKYDEHRTKFSINKQRPLMIELDKFVRKLHPGHNEIRRHANDSSVTMPRELIFDRMADTTVEHDQCQCGWPEYMLVPKGKYEGMTFQLYVTVTNYEEDFIVRFLISNKSFKIALINYKFQLI
ncbi:Polyphenol oxidase 1 [Chamberlinius hualienensis]